MTSATVSGLLSHPTWRAVRVLAGEPSAHPEVATVDVVAHIGLAQGSDRALVVCVTEPSQDDWRIDAALRRIADAHGAALLLATRSPLTPTTAELAKRLGVVVLGTEGDVLEAAVLAKELIEAPQIDRANQLLRAQRMLARNVVEAAAVPRILRDVLGARTELLDRDGKPLEGGDIMPSGFRPHPAAPQRCEQGDAIILACPVLAPDGHHAEMWLAASLLRPDTGWERTVTDVLEVAAGAVQRVQALGRVEVERDARVRATLLGELLRLHGEPPAALRQRVSHLGWRLDGWHSGFYLGVGEDIDVLGATGLVTSALRNEGVSAVVVERPNGWSGWVTADTEPTPAAARRLAAAIRRTQRGLRESLDPHAGVGRSHSGPAGVAKTLGEAYDAARLASTRAETGRFLHVDQLGFAQLLLAWTRTDTFQPAAHELLAPLTDQTGDLLKTLKAYLDTESSLAETAAIIGVHRNTVATRIARIEHLLGVSITDPEQRLALHLACRTIDEQTM